MLLAVDIGNTNTVVGLFERKRLQDELRIATRVGMTADEIGLFLTGWLLQRKIEIEAVRSSIISSVVPSLTDDFEQEVQKLLGSRPIIVTARTKLPITIDIDNPDQVGADRIANSVAAYTKFGGPVIAVDFGTATNIDVINTDGVYIGGVLIPGPRTSMSELARKAARLYEVNIEQPARVVGRSTTEALMSGLYYGTVGQVDYLIEKIISETDFKNPPVVATGGLADMLVKQSSLIKHVEPNLTLEGLRIISEFNSS